MLNLVTEMLTPENKRLPIEFRIKCKWDLLPPLRAISSDETTSACFRNTDSVEGGFARMAGRKYLKMQQAIPNKCKAVWQRKVFQDQCTVEGFTVQPGHRQAGEQGRVSFLIKNVHLKRLCPVSCGKAFQCRWTHCWWHYNVQHVLKSITAMELLHAARKQKEHEF